ncbi:CHAT domain-containing protein [Agrobacterium sp. 22-223-1]
MFGRKRRRHLRLQPVLLFLLSLITLQTTEAAGAEETIKPNLCRTLAAWPSATNDGPTFEAVDGGAAVEACEREIAERPDVQENYAHLARALVKSNRASEAFTLLVSHEGHGSRDVDGYLAVMYEYGYGVSVDTARAAQLYNSAAKAGHDGAQANLGLLYLNGRGVEKDDALAFHWFHEAAIRGYRRAQRLLGDMYLDGRGTKRDEAKAIHWYRLAASRGDTEAQYSLGNVLANKLAEKHDATESARYFAEAAKGGHSNAFVRLGIAYQAGLGVPSDEKKAVELFRQGAELGDAEAQYRLGMALELGQGTEQNFVQAVLWYRRSAEKGYAEAQTSLGCMYERGFGVPQDAVEAFRWYKKAAKGESASGQWLLGTSFMYGRGVPVNEHEAVRYYRLAAEQGYALAQASLGEALEAGIGITKNYEQAVKWFEKAAEQGLADAAYNLGRVYESADGVKKDPDQSLKWYTKAAAVDARAKYKIGEMYANGSIKEQDDLLAVTLMQDAARLGSTEAKIYLARYHEKLFRTNTVRAHEGEQSLEMYMSAASEGDSFAQQRLLTAFYETQDVLHGIIRQKGRLSVRFERVSLEIAGDHEHVILDCFATMFNCGRAAWARIDLRLAVKWYRISASQNYDAAFRLGRLLYSYPELQDLPNEAMHYLERAVHLGSVEARFFLTAKSNQATEKRREELIIKQLLEFDPVTASKIAAFGALGGYGDEAITPSFSFLVRKSRDISASPYAVALAAVYAFYGAIDEATAILESADDAGWFDVLGWDYTISNLLDRWLQEAQIGKRPKPADVAKLERMVAEMSRKGSASAARLQSKVNLLKDIVADPTKISPQVDAISPEAAELDMALVAKRIKQKEKQGGLSPSLIELYRRLAADQIALGLMDAAADSALKALAIGQQINDSQRHINGSLVYHLEQSCQLQKASALLFDTGRKETALFLAKNAVNELQDARSILLGMPEALQGCFKDILSDQYRYMAELFIRQGHFYEAEWVLAQLKDYEAYAFTGRNPLFKGKAFDHMPIDPGQVAFATKVRGLPVIDQYRLQQRIENLNAISDLTQDQQVEKARSEADLARAAEELRDSFKRLRNAMANLEAITVSESRKEAFSDEKLDRRSAILNDLTDNVAIVSAVVLTDRLHFLVTTRMGTEHIELSLHESVLNGLIGKMRTAIQDTSSDPADSAKLVYDAVWKKVDSSLKLLNISDVVLSMDRQLRYIPFAALHDGKTYLVERYRFTNLTEESADQLLAPGTLGSSLRAQALGASRGGEGFSPLENVQVEIDSIVKDDDKNDKLGVINGQRWLDSAFDRRGLRVALSSGFPVVHIASHFALGDTQANSRLLLGDGSVLSLSELERGIEDRTFNFARVRLLVLSACQTALGNGQEFDSLAAMFERRGVRSVVATLWPVKDISTSVLMIKFYTYLRDGLPRGEALRQAQLDLLGDHSQSSESGSIPIRSSAQQFSHPVYWAPFVLLGQWK